eukprot:SAG22_NODE_7800_length_707_cov_1.689145_1_plen_163_part_01
MHIQERIPAGGLNPDGYRFLRSIGVDFVSIDRLPTDHVQPSTAAAWRGYFLAVAAEAEAHGLRLYSAFIGVEDCIWQGAPVGARAAEIERWCHILEGLGAAGIGWAGYNFKYGNQRTTSATGRGGSSYSTFVMDELSEPRTSAVAVSEGQMWANLKSLLEAVV